MKTQNSQNITAVQLGRFAPYHYGHQSITEAMIKKYGIKNSLLLIGSSNVLNERTPYTFEFRKDLIHHLFPSLEIIPLPDINPALLHFEISTMDEWLQQLKNIEISRNTTFIFVGGPKEDLDYLRGFRTEILIPVESKNRISSTLIRKLIKSKDYKKLYKLVNPEIVPLIISNESQI